MRREVILTKGEYKLTEFVELGRKYALEIKESWGSRESDILVFLHLNVSIHLRFD